MKRSQFKSSGGVGMQTLLAMVLVGVMTVGSLSPAGGIADALAQMSQGMIDAAAIGKSFLTVEGDCWVRVQPISMFVANDDPNDVNDAIYLVDLYTGAVTDTLPSPRPHPQGLSTGGVEGDPGAFQLWVVNDDPDPAHPDSLFLLDTSGINMTGAVIDSMPASGVATSKSSRALCESETWMDILISPDPACIGQAFETVSEIWIANRDTLCLIDEVTGGQIRKLPSPEPTTHGLEIGWNLFDTTELWVVGPTNDTLYLIDTATGATIRTLPAPGDHSTGLAHFGFLSWDVTDVDGLTTKMWQGENVVDTMELIVTTDHSTQRRIYPDCCDPGGGSTGLTDAGGPVPPGGHILGIAGPSSTEGGQLQYTITLALPAEVDVSVYDVSGRYITGALTQELSAGAHAFTLDTNHVSGGRLASGIYFLHLEADRVQETRRFYLVR